MCGRFTLTKEMREVAARFGVNYPRGFAGTGAVEAGSGEGEEDELTSDVEHSTSNAQGGRGDGGTTAAANGGDRAGRPTMPKGPRFNIAPTQTVIVVSDDGVRRLVAMAFLTFLWLVRWGGLG